MEITPDQQIFFQYGFIVINATLIYSWVVMVVLLLGSWLITRNITHGRNPSRWQIGLETIVGYMMDQIREVISKDSRRYLPFIGTLFLFISVSNLLNVVPVYTSPAASLSTTAALAVCVFIAVPLFGVMEEGVADYLRNYIEPSPLMLPFHIISEFSRTFALAVRLFGNIMSGNLIIGILISILPFVVPVVFELFSLLIGQIQAYIFAILALVYIGSAVRSREEKAQQEQETSES